MFPRIRKAANAALDLVYPRGVACTLCGVDLDGSAVLCAACAERLPARSGPACPCCGRSVPARGRCRMCVEFGPAADGGFAAYDYADEAQRLMLSFKFGDRPGLRELFAHGMVEAIRADGAAPEIDCVVAVPMHPLRQFNRGYNQSALLASWVADALDRPFLRSGLTRPVYTRGSARAAAGPEVRHDSARRSYRPGKADLADRAVLLVDDILTTGATIRVCGDILRRMGAAKVYCAVAAAVPEQ